MLIFSRSHSHEWVRESLKIQGKLYEINIKNIVIDIIDFFT